MDADQIEFRNALGLFATGITVITSMDGDTPMGLTANSFNSVSLDPPLVLWSMAKSSSMLSAYQKAPGFCIHVLGSDQQELSNRFAGRAEDRFANLDWQKSQLGLPLISGCVAHFECRSEHQYEGGDHIIFVGRVESYAADAARPVLGYHRGKYVEIP